ncbi:hypothetical protein [Methylomonas sp. MgM2]
MRNISKLSVLAALGLTSGVAVAHLNIAVEDAIAVGDGAREYKEGSSAFLDVNVSHDCTNAEGKHFPTVGVALLLPNGATVQNTYSEITEDGTVHGANAVMGVKQRLNPNFAKNIVVKGNVDPFYNHGVNTTDARALKWLRGRVDNDHYDNLEFKTNFPKIDPASCVSKIKIYFPSVQYCKAGYKSAWINTGDSKFGMGDDKTHVYHDYAASIDVVRTSDLPDTCDGDGEVVEVMPTVNEINMYLDDKSHSHGDHHDD